MRVAITGATGFIGTHLVQGLRSLGAECVLISRNASRGRQTYPDAHSVLEWDPQRAALDTGGLEGVDSVVHLTGETVAQRWTTSSKRAILESRVLSTRALVKTLGRMHTPPQVLVSASAIGFYGPRDDTAVTEKTAPGTDFLADMCCQWESEAAHAEQSNIRVVNPRIGIVLGRGGGALSKMLTPFRLGLGGPIGNGRQWMSWIHIEDVVGLILHALQTPALRGPVNATAPGAVTNREFAKVLGQVLHRPAILPTPVFGLKLLYGEFADILATGQRVMPEAALASGYRFRFGDIEKALADVV